MNEVVGHASIMFQNELPGFLGLDSIGNRTKKFINAVRLQDFR
jgi:hypothetical protein